MSKYLYNGVELPGLPETWNETEHPNLFIRVVSIDGSAENAVYSLFAASAAAVSYDDNGILFPLSAVGEKYAVSEGAWVESSESLSDSFYIKRNDGFLYTLWANFDILNSDGSVYIAASEPVPVVGKFPLREWVGWLLAGLCSRPLPMGAREPVAWLYNGVRLPELSKYCKGVYSYIMLQNGAYFLFSSAELPYYGTIGSYDAVYNDGPTSLYKDAESHWEDWHFYASGVTNTLYTDYAIVWSNFDICRQDGSVVFAASAPIPVYE